MPDPTGGFVSFSNNKEIKGEIPSKMLQPLNHNLQLRKAKSGGACSRHPAPPSPRRILTSGHARLLTAHKRGKPSLSIVLRQLEYFSHASPLQAPFHLPK